MTTFDVKTDDGIVSLAKKENVFYLRRSLPNKINRWFHCFQQYNLDAAMLVDANDSSFVYSVFARALCQLNKEKTDFINYDDTMMPGLMTYGISKNGFQKLYNEAKEKELDTDVIEVFIDKANLKTSVIKPNDGEELVPKIRLTIDYKEDITFIKPHLEKFLMKLKVMNI